jgi:transcriptional regulator with XRE-family HTH domain
MQAICYNSTNVPYNGAMQTGRPSTRPRPPFGQRLHDFRERAGLTQQQLAEQLGISSRAYAFWEREPIAIKAEQMAILAETLSVSADELIGREAPKSKANGPTGKLRLIFQRASELPRTQQAKVAEFVEAFVEQQTKTS